MENLKENSYIHKSLYSVLVMCLICLFSTKSFATNETHTSAIAGVVNLEFNSVEVGLDDNDSSDPSLYYDNNVDFDIVENKAVIYTFDSSVFQNHHFTEARAPPLN